MIEARLGDVACGGTTFLNVLYQHNAAMGSRFFTLLLLSVMVVGLRPASAQDYIPVFSTDYSSRLSMEIDPTAFVLKGYSIHLRYQPMFTDRFLIGIGTYAMKLPEALLNMNVENRDKGWQARIRGAYFIMAEFYPKQANHGWFIGEQIGFQSFKVTNNSEVSGIATFNNLVLMTYGGYSWHPYKGAFFVKPWVGLGISKKVDGTNNVGDKVYNVGLLFPFLTLHLGYTF